MATCELIYDDCMVAMANLPTDSIDLVLCDPPYGTTRNKWDTPLDLAEMWKHYQRIVKPGGAILLTAQTPFDKVLGASNLPMLRYEWIWEKGAATGYLNAKRAPLKAHENVLVFYAQAPTYNPQKTTGHERKVSTATHRRNSKLSSNYGVVAPNTSYDSTERYPRSVLKFSSDKQKSRLHPTQKPLALLEYMIKTYSNPGETVLDNCMGSGGTGVAAQSLDRNFIGMENDPQWFPVACKRIEQAKQREAV